MKAGMVEVELWSVDPQAVAATRATIEMLPGWVPGMPGLLEDGGRFYVCDGFIAFACERQGYVKAVRREKA